MRPKTSKCTKVEVMTSGFDERFHHYCKTSKTYFEAYEKTEIEFESSFGKRKYSNYDSFRVTMNKRMKK